MSESYFKKISKVNQKKIACNNHKQIELNLNKIQQSVNVETKIEEIIQSVEFTGKQFDIFNSKVDLMLNEIKNLKIKNEKIKMKMLIY